MHFTRYSSWEYSSDVFFCYLLMFFVCDSAYDEFKKLDISSLNLYFLFMSLLQISEATKIPVGWWGTKCEEKTEVFLRNENTRRIIKATINNDRQFIYIFEGQNLLESMDLEGSTTRMKYEKRNC